MPVVAATEAEALRLCRELDDLIDPRLAIGFLELLLGNFDLSAYDPEGPLPAVPPTQQAQSTQARVVELAARESLSIRQVAQRVAAARTSRVVAGDPEQVADSLQTWFDTEAADGFVLAPPYFPGGMDDFVDQVTPVLQHRGLLRRRYEGATLRENLGLPKPPNHFHLQPQSAAEPEIW
jgi:alkanesulfonate monooxygenase SsuD/methylene tetrahydromethanopterin reductase-like flavin-dependent oxidoreductase (luciferase family)